MKAFQTSTNIAESTFSEYTYFRILNRENFRSNLENAF